MPQYLLMARVLHVSAYRSVSRDAYLSLCDYVDISLPAINASCVDDSISAYGTGFKRLSLSLSM